MASGDADAQPGARADARISVSSSAGVPSRAAQLLRCADWKVRKEDRNESKVLGGLL